MKSNDHCSFTHIYYKFFPNILVWKVHKLFPCDMYVLSLCGCSLALFCWPLVSIFLFVTPDLLCQSECCYTYFSAVQSGFEVHNEHLIPFWLLSRIILLIMALWDLCFKPILVMTWYVSFDKINVWHFSCENL